MTYYKINDNIIIRYNDNIVFDSQKYIVHQMNENGINIIKNLDGDKKTIADLTKLCKAIPQKDIQEFLDKAIATGIINISDSVTKKTEQL